MKQIILMALILILAAACKGSSNSSTASTPGAKSEAFTARSANDIRRQIASTTADSKKFTDQASPSNVYYTCDRETLPRTCCYYLQTVGGSVYGSPSCTEENH